jgi:hypothetical protein
MSSPPTAQEQVRAEIQFNESLIKMLQERNRDLVDVAKAPPKPLQSKPPNITDSGAIVKEAASKVQWKSKDGGASWFWCFAKNRDGSTPQENKPLLDMIKASATGLVGDGEYEYRLSSDGKFLNKAKSK